jgi:hypothetical protein
MTMHNYLMGPPARAESVWDLPFFATGDRVRHICRGLGTVVTASHERVDVRWDDAELSQHSPKCLVLVPPTPEGGIPPEADYLLGCF